MDYQVSHVQIAGAGAGKTYGLASQIVQRSSAVQEHRIIFAITYTNSAKYNIIKGLIEQIGVVPENIRVLTVHSFLLEMIIFPYSKFIFGQSYNRAVSIPLPSDLRYKNAKLKRLNEYKIIHNEQVFKKAHMILNRKGKTKSVKAKIEIVLHHILASIDSIFVDEAQDLDDDALSVFQFLSEKGLYVYLVGDPKQAIKYPKSFEDFCCSIESRKVKSFSILDNNNESRRVPENHLKLSNNFCKMAQKQTSLNEKLGLLSYIFVDDTKFPTLYEYWKSNECLIYINKRNQVFETHTIKHKIYIPESVTERMKESFNHHVYEFNIWIESIIIEIEENSKKMKQKVVLKHFQEKYGIILEKNEWAEMNEMLTTDYCNPQYNVSSIDRVKGLEAETCVFIIDNSMMEYLTGINKNRNKESNKLYVALTRSMNNLVFAVDRERISCMTKSEIQEWFENKKIPYLNSLDLIL